LKVLDNLKFIIGQNEDLPEKYNEKMFALLRGYDSERLSLEPPSIEFYRNYWSLKKIPDRKYINVFAFNEKEELIGYGFSGWNIKYDNLERGFFQIYVEPKERRKGYGTSIMKKLFVQIPAKITTLGVSAEEGSVGEKFIRHFKQESCFEEIISTANFSDFNLEKVKKIVDEEEKRIEKLGYTFVELEGLDYQKKFDEKKYVQMVEQIWNDMPREEMAFGEDVLTVNRYKEIVDYSIRKGDRNFGIAITIKESTEPIAHTRVMYNKFDPDVIEQDDTGVIHEHRGNGLGLALKYKILEKILTETSAKYWITSNAKSNKHMIRINEKLKHKVVSKRVVYDFGREEWEKI
jgi:GNAT superfamily N-acetyltransferase